MPRAKLDRTDLKIIDKLQENGRITNVELAKHAGISAPPCLRRVRALEEKNVITGYHADIDPAALGYGITVFVFVKLDSQKESDLLEFEKLTKSWGMVRECHLISGETDFLLRVIAKDWDTFQSFLTGQVTAAENVNSVRTAPMVRSAKMLHGAPVATS